MSKKTRYTDEPVGPVKVVHDFLPPPEELAYREESQKVTLSLTKRSIAFFKESAAHYGTPYQTMIRRLLDTYAQNQQQVKSQASKLRPHKADLPEKR
jgi:hypothetical protein